MRVVILGPGAAGKSTFARRLGRVNGVDAIELDSVFWSADVEPLSTDVWVQMQADLTVGDAWILDGDLGPHDVLQPRLERADVVVLFDPPLYRCVWRAIRRSREQWGFWVWLVTWRRREKPGILAAIERYAPDARLELVRNDQDADRLLSVMFRP